MQLIIHFPLLFLQWGFFVSLHPSADTLAVFNSARYILYTPIADYHSDTNIHHTHETLALSTSPGVVYISVVCIYRRVCTRKALPGKGCGGTEFLGTRKKLFCVKVYNAKQRLIIILHINPIFHCAKIVSYCQMICRLNTRENTCHFFVEKFNISENNTSLQYLFQVIWHR